MRRTGAKYGQRKRVLARAAFGLAVTLGVLFHNPDQAVAAGPTSDDFHAASLNAALWTVVNPVGDGTVSLTGTNALLSVPAGTAHDVWTGGNNSVRIMQAITNVDFEVEAKFESPVASRYQFQGIIVEQDSLNYLRLEMHHDGATPRLFVASFAAGVPTIQLDTPIPSAGPPFWIRVKRVGNNWTYSSSTTGSSFTTAVTFAATLTVSKLGPYAGNTGSPVPAHTTSVDYFFNTVSPISPEDGGAGDTTAPVLSGISSVQSSTAATVSWSTNEAATSKVEYGTTTAYGSSSPADPALLLVHSVQLGSLTCGTTYNFKVTSSDGSGNAASSPNAAFTTSACGTAGAGPASDDFSAAVLNAWWTFVNPVGDGSFSLTGASEKIINLTLPSGTDHDVWISGNRSARIMQATANLDFEVEVKWLSAVTTGSQQQGIIVEQDAGNFLRFDLFHDGTSPRLFAASFLGGTPTIRLNAALPGTGAPFWMRVKRVGNTWTQSYSTNGTAFTQGVSFSHQITVAKIGPFAGNTGASPPAWTAILDYFFSTDSPVTPEDGPGDSIPPVISAVAATPTASAATIMWTTNEAANSRVDYGTTTGYGSTVSDPAFLTSHSINLPALTCGTLYDYKVSSADPSNNTASSANKTFSTGACGDVTPPVISGVTATPTAGSATIAWTTNEAANSRVDFGTTTAYGTTVSDPAFLTGHSLNLPGLTCNTLYNYKITSADASNNPASTGNLTFTTSACPAAGGPVSDDFSAATLDARWTFVNPAGDGSFSLTGTTDRLLNLTLPSGTAHDVWTGGNNSIRMMQTISNVDFEAEVKWASAVTAGAQLQGIIVEASAGNYLRFDIFHDGTSPRIFAASFVSNAPTVRLNTALPGAGAPVWLRVTRTGNSWTLSHSTSGSTFTPDITFSHTLTVTKIGPFAGNASSPAPAFVSKVDYFFNTASPISPEDGPIDNTPPLITGVTVTPAVTSATVAWMTNEAATSKVDYGPTSAYGGTVADSSFLTTHSLNLPGLTCNTVYNYRIGSTDAANNPASTSNATFTTSPCSLTSDDFHAGTLNPALWTFVNPLGDGTFSLSGMDLLLSVPAGVAHDVWTGGNNSVRVMQSIANEDFEAEVKFESPVTTGVQIQGLLVEQDNANYLRLEVNYVGGGRRLFAASFTGGIPTVQIDTPIVSAGPPFWLRVKRLGSNWTFSSSTDGSAFTPAVTFAAALTVTKLGPFAANTGSPAPAFTSMVDYVFNTASPIVPEDGGVTDTTPPVISGIAAVQSASAATITWTTDEISTGKVEYGPTAAYSASLNKPALVTGHSVALGGLTCNTLYHYRVSSVDFSTNLAVSADRSFTTSPCGTPGAGPVSDDFRAAAFNTGLWTFVNPVGDGSASLNGTDLLLSVPAGVFHDVWTGANNSARIMQPAANLDFEVEVKFESPVTAGTQQQGIIAEQDGANYIRFDIFHDGASPRIFAATFVGGTPTPRINFALSGTTAPYWLRVKRVGDNWQFSYSANGVNFTGVGTFTHPLTLTKIGPFAGNSGASPPAFTALVDYFFNTDAPIVPEDESIPPVISNVSAAPGVTMATITWTTDEPSTSSVGYGTTTTYGNTSPVNTALVTSHSAGLTGLTCRTLYNYRVNSADAAGNLASSNNFTFTTGSCLPPGSPLSDDFRAASLNTSLWTFVNPLGDGSVTVTGTTDRTANLILPSGAVHDVWTGGDQAIRLMQTISNLDFEIEVKWLTLPSTSSQLQGIIIEESPGTYLRFDVFHDGTSPRLFAASFVANAPTVRINTALPGAVGPFWMRIKRAGNAWTQAWSTNGSVFTNGAAFTQTLTTTKAGPFAGNFKSPTPAPAFMSMIDYFFNTAAPIVPEDGPPDNTPPNITGVLATPAASSATIAWTTDEPATSRVDYGTTTSYGANVSDLSLLASHSLNLPSLTCGTPYNYKITALDAAGNPAVTGNLTFTTSACPPAPVLSNVVPSPAVTSATIAWATDITATSRVDYGTTTSYGANVSDPSLLSSHSLNLPALACGTLYNFKITSANAANIAASTGNLTFSTSACPAGPILSGISAAPGSSSVLIAWTTNLAASSKVDYGTTTTYGAVVSDPALVTSHSVNLPGLTCNTLYDFKVSSTDGSNTTASSGNLTFTTGACAPSGSPVSDDFSSSGLNTGLWTFVNPLGDGSFSLTGSSEKVLNLILASGASHDVWTGGDQAIRVMQSISNLDFEIEVKWLTLPSTGSQLQGIIVEDSPGTFLRFDVFHDGTSPRIFAASFVANTPTARGNTALPGTVGPFWMRVKRIGNTWTETYSTNGTSFTTAVSFSQTLTVSKAGPFAGNFKSPAPAPAFTSMVDYFFNTASPVSPEDGPPDATPPVITFGGAAVSPASATITWTTDDPSTSKIDYGTTTTYGAIFNDPGLVTNHSVDLAPLACNTTYNHKITSVNGATLPSSTGNLTFTTSACPPPAVGAASDDFHTPALNAALWTFVNPLGDGSFSLTGTTDKVLNLILPSGSSHDAWTGSNDTIRVMQTVPNGDFEVEVKFESAISVRSQLQGIIVEQSPGNYIRFGTYFDGSVPRLFAATFANNVPTIRDNSALCIGSGPFWLRVKKAGNTWNQSWSTLGTSFTAGLPFSYALTVSKIGPYAGNVGFGGPAPAWTSIIDYFFNTNSPIAPEDGSPFQALAQAPFGNGAANAPGASSGVALESTPLVISRLQPLALQGTGSAAKSEPVPDDPAPAPGEGIADSSLRTDLFGPPGPTIDVWYGDTQSFGQNGKPQPFVNILGTVSDPDGVSSLKFTLNGGPQQTLSIGPNATRLVDPGDFNLEIDYANLVAGSNPVVITAIDGLGNVSTRTVTINYVNGGPWPRSYAINWATAASIQSVSQIVDGKWAIQPGGSVRTMQVGYDRLISLGDMTTWDNYETTTEVTMNSLDCASDFGVGMIVGWKGHTGTEQPRVGHPFPGLGWYAKFPASGSFLNIYTNTTLHPEHIQIPDATGRILSLGVKYIFKFRVVKISATVSRYSLKVWPASSAEPAAFDLVFDGEVSQGSLILGAHKADVTFGAITVTGL